MKISRRSMLTTAGIGSLSLLAGCLSSDDPPEPPVVGDPDAAVTVEVYEDFSCQACLEFKNSIYPIIEAEYLEPGEIRYEFRNFPIPVDETWSWAVASAGRELFEQEGDEAFFAFSDEIYDHQGAYSYDVIESVTDDLGYDGEAVRGAAEEDAHRSTLEEDKAVGESRGASGTPTVFVDGERVDDARDTVPTIDDALN